MPTGARRRRSTTVARRRISRAISQSSRHHHCLRTSSQAPGAKRDSESSRHDFSHCSAKPSNAPWCTSSTRAMRALSSSWDRPPRRLIDEPGDRLATWYASARRRPTPGRRCFAGTYHRASTLDRSALLCPTNTTSNSDTTPASDQAPCLLKVRPSMTGDVPDCASPGPDLMGQVAGAGGAASNRALVARPWGDDRCKVGRADNPLRWSARWPTGRAAPFRRVAPMLAPS